MKSSSSPREWGAEAETLPLWGLVCCPHCAVWWGSCWPPEAAGHLNYVSSKLRWAACAMKMAALGDILVQ